MNEGGRRSSKSEVPINQNEGKMLRMGRKIEEEERRENGEGEVAEERFQYDIRKGFFGTERASQFIIFFSLSFPSHLFSFLLFIF